MYTVSVIIPTYNREDLIQRSIESVLSQEYEALLEVIVVDDCSTDNTRPKIDALKNEKIRYIKLDQNQGAANARNKGVVLAKGDLIAFQDSDDFWRKGKLSKEVSFLSEMNADLVFHAFTRYNPQTGLSERIPDNTFPQGQISYSDLLPFNKASTQTFLAKREVLLENPFSTSIPSLEDWELVLRLCMNDLKVFYLNEDLASVIFQDDSISRDFEKSFWSLNTINTIAYPRYQNELFLLRNKLFTCQEELAQAQEKVAFYCEQVKRAKKAYEEIQNTISWKITAPLRKFRKKRNTPQKT